MPNSLSFNLLPRFQNRRAFTLIELLTVIAIIGILGGLVLTIAPGMRDNARKGAAKVEVEAIAVALEAYKRQYGDYPQTGRFPQAGLARGSPLNVDSAQAKLFNSLFGKLGPKGNILQKRNDAGTVENILGPVFYKHSSMSPENGDIMPSASGDEVENCLLDPWERRYVYFYRRDDAPAQWNRPGFILFSAGPDGLYDPAQDDGAYDASTERNLDNIVFGLK